MPSQQQLIKKAAKAAEAAAAMVLQEGNPEKKHGGAQKKQTREDPETSMFEKMTSLSANDDISAKIAELQKEFKATTDIKKKLAIRAEITKLSAEQSGIARGLKEEALKAYTDMHGELKFNLEQSASSKGAVDAMTGGMRTYTKEHWMLVKANQTKRARDMQSAMEKILKDTQDSAALLFANSIGDERD